MRKIVVIIHISGDRAIFIIFDNHQDTLSDRLEMENFVARQIFTQKIIKGYMGLLYTHFKIRKIKIVVILRISRDRAIFLLFFDQGDTESEWQEIDASVSRPVLTYK